MKKSNSVPSSRFVPLTYGVYVSTRIILVNMNISRFIAFFTLLILISYYLSN